MSNVKLTIAGIQKWNQLCKISPDPEQVFTVKYDDGDGDLWLGSWWGETCIMPKSFTKAVFWCETAGDWV